jgi:hypothetical protein
LRTPAGGSRGRSPERQARPSQARPSRDSAGSPGQPQWERDWGGAHQHRGQGSEPPRAEPREGRAESEQGSRGRLQRTESGVANARGQDQGAAKPGHGKPESRPQGQPGPSETGYVNHMGREERPDSPSVQASQTMPRQGGDRAGGARPARPEPPGVVSPRDRDKGQIPPERSQNEARAE